MRVRPFVLILAALVCLAPAAAGAQEPEPLRTDERVVEALAVVETWLDAQRAYEQIPGVSAAIVAGEEQVWSGAFGAAHPATGAAATPTTLYSICSISKLFTSMAIMQLRDAGELRLSDPVADHLPWYTMEEAEEGAPPVTIEGVLTHSSGLPRESDHPYWSQPDFQFPDREEIIEGLENQKALYAAWDHYQYSNLGLTLAGEIVRERSGMPYEDYVRQNILAPLGLTDTRPFMPEEERDGRLATGYSAITRDGVREPLPFFQARGITPAAGFTSTAEDLARFAAWQFGLVGDDPVLHEHTLAEMQRVHYVDPGWDNFRGLGFGVYRDDGRTFTGHSGSCPGYRTQLLLDTDEEIATVFMANASGVDTHKFATAMYDLVRDALLAAPEDRDSDEPVEAPEEAAGDTVALDDYIGTYDVQPWGGEAAAVRWKGGLAMLHMPTNNPARALARLEHVEGDTFRRIREDGDLGESITFLRDDSGRVIAYRQFQNVYRRVR